MADRDEGTEDSCLRRARELCAHIKWRDGVSLSETSIEDIRYVIAGAREEGRRAGIEEAAAFLRTTDAHHAAEYMRSALLTDPKGGEP